MFDNLTGRLKQTFRKLTGQSHITEDNIGDVLAEIRKSLIEADVALPVVSTFIERVKSRALGTEIDARLNAEQAFIEILNDVLVETMGRTAEPLNFRAQPPVTILMAGLQGAGKTTTVAKLARLLKNQKKKVLVVSADVYRPAAIQQLQVLAHEVGVDFYPSEVGQNPVDIATNAKAEAKRFYYDVLIVDTAGRLHVDESMMDEIKGIHAAINPTETLFTVDAMTGQDAANTARAFDQALPLTGVVLTKLDGDSRGGAALSIREITGKPIKFFGMGEKTDALEVFHPDRIASRILDLGDMLSLIERIKTSIPEEQSKKASKRFFNKEDLDFNDLLEQLGAVNKMGSMSSIIGMLPGGAQLKEQVNDAEVEKKMARTRAIVQSMTPKERANPKLLKHTRKLRISKGCGLPVSEINKLITQLDQMNKFKKMMAKNPMSMMSQMANLFRGRPPF